MPDLLTKEQQRTLVEMVERHQRDDGGWSLRTFAAPEAWGRGNRAAKLRGEPEFRQPQSDGHMTGMALLALREAGVPAADLRIQRGVTLALEESTRLGTLVDPLVEHGHEALHHLQRHGPSAPGTRECHALPIESTAKSN